jgi:hypothetical protein
VVFVPSDAEKKGWIWAAVWVVSALFMPLGALAGLVAVGPFVTTYLARLFQSIF